MNALETAIRMLKASGRIKYDIEIAKELGFTKALISNILNGRGKISPKLIARFKEVYEIDLEEIQAAIPDNSNVGSLPIQYEFGMRQIMATNSVILDMLCEIVADKNNVKLSKVKEIANQKIQAKLSTVDQGFSVMSKMMEVH